MTRAAQERRVAANEGSGMYSHTPLIEKVLPLASPAASADVAGGKAAGLSRLIRAGFPVPSGYVISTSAYRDFVAANGLADEVEARAPGLRARFEAGEIPDDIADAVLRAYREISAEANAPVAVRSSATAEDLPSASFAGQQDTYLNVIGETGLLAAVRACWASLWNERAVAYRARQQIDSTHISMAVVVQQMVPAEAAGVLFTVNPVTGNDQEVMINATWGLGEALVGGRVDPDTLVIDKTNGTVKRQTLGDKALMTVPAQSGTVDVSVDAPQRRRPALTTTQATELARLGRDIEAAMGGPQDVEWAIAGGRVIILQTRPVTASRQPNVSAVPGDDVWPLPDERPVQPFDLWTHADMGERWPEPITPLTWSLAGATTNPNFRYALRDLGGTERDDIQWSRRFYGRVYLNEGALAEIFCQAGFPTSLIDVALGSGVPLSLRRNAPLRPVRLLRGAPRLLRVARQRERNATAFEVSFPRIERWVADFQTRDLGSLSDDALWQDVQGLWWPRLVQSIDQHADGTSLATGSLAILNWLVQRWGGSQQLARDLVGSIANVRAAEMAPTLWQIGQLLRQAGLAGIVLDNAPAVALARLRREPAAGPALGLLEQFLKQHGHRATIEAELLYPRWAEAPEQVIAALVGYLHGPETRDPREIEADNRRRRDAAAFTLDARLSPLRRWIVHRLVARAQRFIRLRDNGQHYVVMLVLPARRLCAELGTRWAARGWLAQPEDVFFLDASEITRIVQTGDVAASGLNLRALVGGRRAAYEHWFGVSAPDVLGADGLPVTTLVEDSTGSRLVGLPVSGGRATGPARIAHSPLEAAKLQAGEILVARSTDPSWTPAFALASGLVLEIGGELSHGAIVAREFGLPAVVNVRDALNRIHAGQSITVDGTAGLVFIEDSGVTFGATT